MSCNRAAATKDVAFDARPRPSRRCSDGRAVHPGRVIVICRWGTAPLRPLAAGHRSSR